MNIKYCAFKLRFLNFRVFFSLRNFGKFPQNSFLHVVLGMVHLGLTYMYVQDCLHLWTFISLVLCVVYVRIRGQVVYIWSFYYSLDGVLTLTEVLLRNATHVFPLLSSHGLQWPAFIPEPIWKIIQFINLFSYNILLTSPMLDFTNVAMHLYLHSTIFTFNMTIILYTIKLG